MALTDPLKLLQEHSKGKGNFTKEKKHRVVTMLELNMRYPSHVYTGLDQTYLREVAKEKKHRLLLHLSFRVLFFF